jgi:thioredoxin-like negative regulator of GroEL
VGTELAGRLKVVKLDVDSAGGRGALRRHEHPAVVLFRGGEEIDRLVGAVPGPQLRQ